MVGSKKTKLQEYLDTEDEKMVEELDSIHNIVMDHYDIVPKIGVPDFKIKFTAEKADLTRVDQYLNTMHQIDFETNNHDKIQKMLEDMFLIERNWI